MTKISFIGAGSTVFAKNLLGDILSYPELRDATISLFDIDPLSLIHISDRKVRAGQRRTPVERRLDFW